MVVVVFYLKLGNMGCFENSRTALVLEVSKFLDINGEQECESYCLEQNIRKYFGLQVCI